MAALEALYRGPTIMMAVFGTFTTLAAFAGVYLIATTPNWANSTTRAFAPLFLIFGFGAIAVWTWTGLPFRFHLPRRLRVTDVAIELSDAGSRPPRVIRWDSRGFRIKIDDLSEMPPKWQDGSPRLIDYVLHVPRCPDVAIPREAFLLIEHESRRRGFRIQRNHPINARDPNQSVVRISASR